jgi:hypothetical protein
MTLDEMIAWLEQQACEMILAAGALESHDKPALKAREEAATLLTIENALRAVRDGVAV